MIENAPQDVDPDDLDELIQTYAAEHPWDELDHAGILVMAWTECGGTGGLAEVHTWARDAVPRDGHHRPTLNVLEATGWTRGW